MSLLVCELVCDETGGVSEEVDSVWLSPPLSVFDSSVVVPSLEVEGVLLTELDVVVFEVLLDTCDDS